MCNGATNPSEIGIFSKPAPSNNELVQDEFLLIIGISYPPSPAASLLQLINYY